MVHMNDTSSQMVQPPPHELPAPAPAYNSWAVAGVFVYVGFFALVAGGLALWHELRCLRRSAEALLTRISEVRASLRPEARP